MGFSVSRFRISGGLVFWGSGLRVAGFRSFSWMESFGLYGLEFRDKVSRCAVLTITRAMGLVCWGSSGAARVKDCCSRLKELPNS